MKQASGINGLTFKRQPHKIVKHTQTSRRQIALTVFDHFVGLALKWLSCCLSNPLEILKIYRNKLGLITREQVCTHEVVSQDEIHAI